MNDRIPRRLRRIGVAVMLLGVVGCATNGSNYGGSATGGGTRMTMDTAEIPPATLPRRPVEGLLEDASEALRLANAAQEAGDPAEARYQYTLMLELLIEADLDPGVFYALREPLGNIVDTSVRHAALYPQEDGILIPAPLPYRIVREIERIQNEYPSAFQRGLDRSQKYLPYIEAEFEKADLPKDLAWLAIVESNFWPTAVSRSSAGGMWQFM